MLEVKGWSYRFLLLFLLGANGWAQYVLWFGKQGLVQWLQTETRMHHIRKDVHQVEDRIRRLSQEIRLVNKEPLILEEVARRHLGLVHPEEIVFVFSTK